MVITIGREFGSGGRAIGKKLAELLGFGYYDSELLTKVAQSHGFDEEVVTEYDEKPNNSLLYSLYAGTMAATNVVPISQKLATAQFDEIRAIANEENCVIIGRCADYVLRSRKDCVRVYVCAPVEWRMERVIASENIPREIAEKYILRHDKNRQKYYEFYTGQRWGDPNTQDICINSAALGIDGTVELLAAFARARLGLD